MQSRDPQIALSNDYYKTAQVAHKKLTTSIKNIHTGLGVRDILKDKLRINLPNKETMFFTKQSIIRVIRVFKSSISASLLTYMLKTMN